VISLVMGGARSGKSEVAERLAKRQALGEGPQSGQLTYVATAAVGNDASFDARIALHQARRGPDWTTAEVPRGGQLRNALAVPGTVLVDSLGTWVAGWPGFAADVDDLVAALESRRSMGRATVLVTDEAGLGVHPESAEGLAFRDTLGVVNRRVADIADDVWLVVAGRVLVLPREDPAGGA
jgi:adenosylcobinamide kinase/adenosylcobinamide-phosphate guanylyltransferase